MSLTEKLPRAAYEDEVRLNLNKESMHWAFSKWNDA